VIRARRAAVVACLFAAMLLVGCSGSDQHSGARRTARAPSATTATTPGSPPTSTAGSGPGLSPLGAHWDISRRAAFDPYLESLRGTATYTEVVWCKVEKSPGKRDWSKIDAVSASAQQHGIELYLKIRVGACWATGGSGTVVRGSADKTESAMPQDTSAYTSFVRDLVQRYSAQGVHVYAVENEVNSVSFWAGTPQQYVSLVRTAAGAIRAADPRAEIADAGMSSTTYGYGIADQLLRAGRDADAVAAWNTYFQRRIGTRGDQVPHVTSAAQLKGLLASEQATRNLAYLQVAHQLAQDKVTDIRQIHFYEPWQAVPLLASYLQSTTPSTTPVQAWEVGSFWKDSTATDSSRATEMVRTVSLLLGAGVRRVIWLPLATSADNRRGQEIRYGLLDPDGGIRPAGVAMQELVASSREVTASAVSTGGLHGVAFAGEAEGTLVVWADKGQVQLDVGSGARTASVGQTFAPASSSTVVVGTEPQLVQTTSALQDVLPG
jgi:hypothetical protein